MMIFIMSDSCVMIHAQSDEGGLPEYGYDISWPMLKESVTTNYPWLPHNVDPENNPTPEEYKGMDIQHFGDRQTLFDEYMQGCRDYWSADERKAEQGDCDHFEDQRLDHNIDQPISMVNFTDVGYKKIKAPANLFKLLSDFWNENKNNEVDELWQPGNAFLNYWSSSVKMVNVQDYTIGGGGKLLEELWGSTVETISEWTGTRLVPSSIYGIRVYKEGAILSSHVDRLPLISSAIINVAQDVDEDWPLEVIGHDGIARNITIQPGEMILYESHSVIHGRPFPLKGKYYANVFIHFEPDPYEAYKEGLPNYILEGSIEATRFRNGEYEGEIPSPNAAVLQQASRGWGAHISHDAAGDGELEVLKKIAEEDSSKLHIPDDNGWFPIHEAARGGHLEVVKFLTDNGADINARTHEGKGFSVLSIFEQFWKDDHPLYDHLVEAGAYDMQPEL
jgi:prolyl 4-hydroxylase